MARFRRITLPRSAGREISSAPFESPFCSPFKKGDWSGSSGSAFKATRIYPPFARRARLSPLNQRGTRRQVTLLKLTKNSVQRLARNFCELFNIITFASKVPLRRKTQFAAAAGSLEVNVGDYIIVGT